MNVCICHVRSTMHSIKSTTQKSANLFHFFSDSAGYSCVYIHKYVIEYITVCAFVFVIMHMHIWVENISADSKDIIKKLGFWILGT